MLATDGAALPASTSLDGLLLLAAAVAVLLAAGTGFWGGILFAQHREQRALQRALSGFQQVFQTVLRRIESAREACGLLEQARSQWLNPEQLQLLNQSRTRLTEQLTRLSEQFTRPPEAPAPRPEPPQIKWQVSPEDKATGFPDKSACESNLEMLLELGRQTLQIHGLLLVRIDKYDGLKERYGLADAKKLLKKFSMVLSRAARDTDLVCQYGPDVFAILLPAVDDAGERLAGEIREAVRSYHFRVDDQGTEVLVTASFGYTRCDVTDNADFALNRALDAMDRSQRMGRNQLHIHDGSALTHCVAG